MSNEEEFVQKVRDCSLKQLGDAGFMMLLTTVHQLSDRLANDPDADPAIVEAALMSNSEDIMAAAARVAFKDMKALDQMGQYHEAEKIMDAMNKPNEIATILALRLERGLKLLAGGPEQGRSR